MKLLLSGILFLGLANAASLTIMSTPKKAQINIMKLNEGDSTNAGVTPFTMDQDQLTSNYSTGPTYIVEIAKEGFESKRYVLTSVKNTDINLEVTLNPVKKLDIMRDIDALINDLFQAQIHIRSQNFSDAEKILNEQSKKFPYVSVIPELKGSLYYLQNDFLKSLDNYNKAVSINPDNLDAYQVKTVLEKTLGFKKDE